MKTTDEIKLLPCPFCQTIPSISNHVSTHDEKLVFCDNGDCAIWGDKCLLSRWQARATHDVSELVEALQKCRDRLYEGNGIEEWLSPDFNDEIECADKALSKFRNLQ